MKLKNLLLAVAIVATPGAATFGHHSYSAFDMSKFITVSGTVTEVQYQNPHVWMFVDVQVGKKKESYAIEAGGPNILRRQGWMANTLKPGDTVEAQLNPIKDPAQKGGSLWALKMPDGKVIGTWKQ